MSTKRAELAAVVLEHGHHRRGQISPGMPIST